MIRDQYNNLRVKFEGTDVEQFTDKMSRKFDRDNYGGIYLDSIVRYSYDQSKKYDEKHRRKYSDGWCDEAVKQGYIYSVSFFGYALDTSMWKAEKEETRQKINNLINGVEQEPSTDMKLFLNHGKRYTEEEIEDLKMKYLSGTSVENCSERFKRKPSSIASKLKELDVLNDPEWIRKLEKYDK